MPTLEELKPEPRYLVLFSWGHIGMGSAGKVVQMFISKEDALDYIKEKREVYKASEVSPQIDLFVKEVA